MHSDTAFETRLARALRTYTDAVALPFDADAIVDGAIGTPRRPMRFGLLLAPLAVLALLAALAVGITLLWKPEPAPTPVPSLDQAVRGGSLSAEAGQGHSATLLADGRVLVLSGTAGADITAAAELWDPSSASSSEAGALTVPRVNASATLLPDGRVLVIGGFGGPYAYSTTAVAAAELWDPTSNAFRSVGALTEPRVGHTASLLPDGRVLVVGGAGADGPVASGEVWDAGSESFTPADALAEARHGHTATILGDGRVLVLGGRTGDGSELTQRAELWDPRTGSFIEAGVLGEPRDAHTSTLLADGRVLVVGGYIGPGYGFGVDDEGRHVVDHPSEEIVAGHLSSAELWDPATGTFTPAASLPEGLAWHTATLLPDGRVAIIGGQSMRDEGDETVVDPRVATQVWDPGNGTFQPGRALNEARHSHSAVLLPNGQVLVVGGVGTGRQFELASVEVWTAEAQD